MQISSTLAGAFRPSASAALTLLGRLAQTQPAVSASATPPGAATLTPEMIRTALLEMGVGASAADIALASALAQTGMALTMSSLAEANGALARAPGATPEAYALARSLGLPVTPDALRALTAVLTAPAKGVPTAPVLPEQVREELGWEMDAETGPEILARHLRERLLDAGRSTEHRLASALRGGDTADSVEDARTTLLGLATTAREPTVRGEADRLAGHLEGQQLLNQAAMQAHTGRAETPLYLAVPLLFGGKPALTEMQVWVLTPGAAEEDEEGGDAALHVTVRVALPRLGRVQADLSGRITGSLACRLGVEKAGAERLLARHTGALASALAEAGWASCEVCCRLQSDWPPLWHGGESLTTPRACVDHHV